jgi:hypothetical protein
MKPRKAVYAANGTKIKCAQGHCEHKTEVMGMDTHDEGLCWKITQEEFADKPTNAKYCPCTKQNNFIRTFERVGYIEREKYDSMVPTKCSTCEDVILLKETEVRCLSCRTMAYNEPVEL